MVLRWPMQPIRPGVFKYKEKQCRPIVWTAPLSIPISRKGLAERVLIAYMPRI